MKDMGQESRSLSAECGGHFDSITNQQKALHHQFQLLQREISSSPGIKGWMVKWAIKSCVQCVFTFSRQLGKSSMQPWHKISSWYHVRHIAAQINIAQKCRDSQTKLPYGSFLLACSFKYKHNNSNNSKLIIFQLPSSTEVNLQIPGETAHLLLGLIALVFTPKTGVKTSREKKQVFLSLYQI